MSLVKRNDYNNTHKSKFSEVISLHIHDRYVHVFNITLFFLECGTFMLNLQQKDPNSRGE